MVKCGKKGGYGDLKFAVSLHSLGKPLAPEPSSEKLQKVERKRKKVEILGQPSPPIVSSPAPDPQRNVLTLPPVLNAPERFGEFQRLASNSAPKGRNAPLKGRLNKYTATAARDGLAEINHAMRMISGDTQQPSNYSGSSICEVCHLPILSESEAKYCQFGTLAHRRIRCHILCC